MVGAVKFLHVSIRIRTSYVPIWKQSIHATGVEEKYTSVIKFTRRNLIGAKTPLRQNVSSSRKCCTKTSAANRLSAKPSQRQNISAQNVAQQKVARQKVYTAQCAHVGSYLRVSVLTAKFLMAKSHMANFPTPKSPTAKSIYGKVSSLRNISTTQCPSGKKSLRQSVPRRKKITAKSPMTKLPTAKSLTAKSTYDSVLTLKCTNVE